MTRLRAATTHLVRHPLLRDVTKLMSGTAIAQAIGLLASPLLTRLFSPNDFGIFSIMIAMMTIIGVWATLRLDMMIPPARIADASAFVRLMNLLSMLLALCSAGIVFMFGPAIARLIKLPPETDAVLWLLPILLVANAAFMAMRALSVREGRFSRVGVSAIIRVGGMTLFWLAIGAALSPDDRYAVMPIGHALGLLAAAAYLASSLPARSLNLLRFVRPQSIGRALKGQIPMVAAVAVGQTFSVIAQRLPIFVIAVAYGPVYAGFYALAERIVLAPSVLVANAMGDVYRQRASKMMREGHSFAPLLRRMAFATFGLSAAGFVLLGLIVVPNMGLVFGIEWLGAAFTVAILIVNAAVGFATTPFDCTSVIVGARRYVVGWQTARVAGVVACSAAALYGGLSYEVFLIALVCVRTLLYLVDFIAVNVFARVANKP
ncbi:lipopolysaccharide biosynthesis protein [Notoacmeibacter marinus]|nr:oligosaccharide flippase family protein [Notoacmeibacter marinus]